MKQTNILRPSEEMQGNAKGNGNIFATPLFPRPSHPGKQRLQTRYISTPLCGFTVGVPNGGLLPGNTHSVESVELQNWRFCVPEAFRRVFLMMDLRGFHPRTPSGTTAVNPPSLTARRAVCTKLCATFSETRVRSYPSSASKLEQELKNGITYNLVMQSRSMYLEAGSLLGTLRLGLDLLGSVFVIGFVEFSQVVLHTLLVSCLTAVARSVRCLQKSGNGSAARHGAVVGSRREFRCTKAA
jgi:hypothetical protein